MIEYLGCFKQYPVAIDGYEVPLLDARESDDGVKCHITLDRRFGAEIPAECAHEVIWLIANALAIGAGFSCHGENSQKENPYRVKVSEIGG